MRGSTRPSLYSLLTTFCLINYGNAATLIRPSTANLTANAVDLTSAFVGNRIRLNDTVLRVVQDRFDPATSLLKVQATVHTVEPSADPLLLTDVQVIFSLPPNTSRFKSLIVQMSDTWGVWNAPTPNGQDFAVQNHLLNADALAMDILEADQRIKEAGYAQRYWGADLRAPKPAGHLPLQPYWLFAMEDAGPGSPDVVTVGVVDKLVRATLNAAQQDWTVSNGGDTATA